MTISDTRNSQLKFSDHVRPPEEYLQPRYPDDVAEAFNQFSESCMDFFSYDDAYPNATMHVEPVPADIEPATVSFLVVWGKGTEIPHPRHHKIPEYFGSTAIALAKLRHRSLSKALLDGHGFLGRVMNQAGFPIVKSVIGGTNSQETTIFTNQLLTRDLINLSVMDIASNLQLYRPLRFHAGVKWHANNDHIFNEFFPENLTRALRNI